MTAPTAPSIVPWPVARRRRTPPPTDLPARVTAAREAADRALDAVAAAVTLAPAPVGNPWLPALPRAVRLARDKARIASKAADEAAATARHAALAADTATRDTCTARAVSWADHATAKAREAQELLRMERELTRAAAAAHRINTRTP